MKLKLKIVMKKVPEGWAQYIYLKVDHHAISKVTLWGVGFLYSLLFWIKWAVFPESWIINGSVKSEKNCQFKLKFGYAKFNDGVFLF